jgi:hypothetical protein
VQCWQRNHCQHYDHSSDRERGVSGHERRPPRPARGWGRGQAASLPGAGANEPQQRWEQRQRDQHGDHDRARRRQSHHRQEWDPDDRQPRERDHHRGAGKHDRAARGRDSARHRLLRVEAVGELLAVAGDDEQRVVDPDRQSQHQRQRRGDRAQLDDPGQPLDRRQSDRDADDRGEQRQPSR